MYENVGLSVQRPLVLHTSKWSDLGYMESFQLDVKMALIKPKGLNYNFIARLIKLEPISSVSASNKQISHQSS